MDLTEVVIAPEDGKKGRIFRALHLASATADALGTENPACNAIVDRQAIGRIDRIGQRLPPKVVRAYYGRTLQGKLYDLLMAKIAISTATDGLDATGALAAAGLDDSATLTGLSIGKQLWKMYEEEMEEAKIVPIAAARSTRSFP